MKNLPVIAAISTVIIIVAGVFLFSSSEAKKAKATPFPLPTTYEYFWLEGCPHCKNVENFMETWDKKDQVKIDKLEVKFNKANGERLIQRGTTCNLAKEEIGAVPLLFTPEGKCISGDEPIINFLKEIK